MIALYVLLSPGFASALADGGLPLRRFLRQVLTNGLPVVVIVNYVGFFLFALSHELPENSRDPAAYIAVDFILSLLLSFVSFSFSLLWPSCLDLRGVRRLVRILRT